MEPAQLHRTPNSEGAENSCSVVTIFKFLIIPSLNISFPSEVQWDRGPHVRTAQHNSHFFLPLQDGFSALCSPVPSSRDNCHPVSPAGSCTQTQGGWGLDTQALGVSSGAWSSHPTTPSRQRAGTVLSDPGTQWGEYSPLGCPSAVDWGSGLKGRADSWLSFPAQPGHSTSVRAHGSPAVSGPGSCAKCVYTGWA